MTVVICRYFKKIFQGNILIHFVFPCELWHIYFNKTWIEIYWVSFLSLQIWFCQIWLTKRNRMARQFKLTSSRTSIPHLPILTRFLFIRSNILPGVAIITCTERKRDSSQSNTRHHTQFLSPSRGSPPLWSIC